MPPKKDGDASMDDKKKARKRNIPRKKKDEVPSRIRKTDRVVLNKQARDIIGKVYDFMKKEALADYAEKLTNARWRTATAVGVSEKTVSRILKDRNKKLNEGSAIAGTEAIDHGNLEAVKNAELAVGNVLTGNFSTAAHNIGNAMGDAASDISAGLNSLASANLASATAHFSNAVGSVVAGDTAGIVSTIFGL